MAEGTLASVFDHTTPIAELYEVKNVAPMVSSYNERIRPILDALENLRRLNITKEGIQLPTIVVVGDQSSGKSSVLESLAGISLPRGQGICTRVPLIMRLQNHSLLQPVLELEYNDKHVPTDEAHVSEAIRHATDELAGSGKAISNTPLTLIVKKNDVPDLTMIDLPGITRVPVQGQPMDIYDQIVNIIMEYIKPEESIILNVLSATVDFSTCESIRMSQSVDKTGERTLAVVTKVDLFPEGLREKVTADDVNIGLGYVCVRNRVGDESYEEARGIEAKLFRTHALLSNIDKSIVGIPVLAEKLVQLQAVSISKILPEIVKKINDKLDSQLANLEKFPRKLNSLVDVMSAFVHVIGLTKESLSKILLRGEFDEYPDDEQMHCTARLVEMLDQYSNDLRNGSESDAGEKFLMEEIKMLEETKRIGLPNFIPRAVFLTRLRDKVESISSIPIKFINQVWDYLEAVAVMVLNRHSEHYHQLQTCIRLAGQNLIAKMRENSMKYMKEVVEMEKLTDYTCNPEYTNEYNKLIGSQNFLVDRVQSYYSKVAIDGFGDVELSHLTQHTTLVPQAFDLKVRLTAYWNIVLQRLIDNTALHLQFSIFNLLNKDLGYEVLKDMASPSGGGIERLFEETPSVAVRRDHLIKSITILKESKQVVASIIDKISTYAN
ncbi:dynamin-related protein 4C-like [Vigna unguiculata]|uniref:dynamin-related protein 4C-like n=1 Tax=Vigna unguiculata TaxID=3917 RepID=UPI001016F1D0|nr:dynamin-related protein 4C-like [Vigna unguiculata]